MTEDQTLEGGSRGQEKADSCMGSTGQELIPTSLTARAKPIAFQAWCVTISLKKEDTEEYGTRVLLQNRALKSK